MTKPSKTPLKIAKNASKLHKHVGQLLDKCDMFAGYEIRQEYRVKDVNSDFKSNREKFDWVVLGMKVVVECHGKQHYVKTRFGGPKDEQKTLRDFRALQARDEAKQKAAEEAGWAYVVVSYKEADITEEELLSRIRDAIKQSALSKTNKSLTLIERISKEKKDSLKSKSKSKIKGRGFQKPSGGYKWPKRKINN